MHRGAAQLPRVTSSPVTVFTTFGPVRNMFDVSFFMMMKSVSAGE
ncbi:MAG: hypothetical protein ACLU5I_07205 [Alistipes finegoldii]